jgi:hypothetical protein
MREHWVSGLAMVYMLAYIGGVWVGAWVIEKSGLRFGVRAWPSGLTSTQAYVFAEKMAVALIIRFNARATGGGG